MPGGAFPFFLQERGAPRAFLREIRWQRAAPSAGQGGQNGAGHAAGCLNAAGAILHHHGEGIGGDGGVTEAHHPAVGAFALSHLAGAGFGVTTLAGRENDRAEKPLAANPLASATEEKTKNEAINTAMNFFM